MLELRYDIEQKRRHSICRGAICHYAHARAQNKVPPQDIADCRFAFTEVTWGETIERGAMNL